MDRDEHTLLLGEIKGKLDALYDKVEGVDGKLDAVSGRVGRLETRAAVHGAVAGGFMSVGIALIIEKVKKGMGL